MVRVQDLLKDPSLFAPDGSQLRPIARSDIDESLLALYVFTRNGMQPAVLQFDGLCLKGADLRGLNPSGDGPFQVSFVRLEIVETARATGRCWELRHRCDTCGGAWPGRWRLGRHQRGGELHRAD